MINETALQQKKEELFNLLLLGYGLPSLLETVSTYLKKSITLCTTNFSIIASTAPVQRAVHFQEESGGRFLNSQSIDMMERSRLLEQLQHSWQPVPYHFSDDPDRDYLFAGIHVRQHTIAYLCLDSTRNSIHEDDGFLLTELAKAVAIEMQKDTFFQEKSGLSQEYLLIDLLEGHIQNSDFVHHRLTAFGIKENGYYQIAAIALDRNAAAVSFTNYYMAELSKLLPRTLIARYQGVPIILLSGTSSELNQYFQSRRFQQFVDLHQLHISKSYRFQQLSHITYYYQQALFALKAGTAVNGTGPRTYDSCAFQHLCSFVSDRKALAAMIHPDILCLQQHDATHHTAYIATLDAYFQAGRNALKAAQNLHIHKSTFFYRLDKIKEATDFTLDNEAILFAYELSLQILHYLA